MPDQTKATIWAAMLMAGVIGLVSTSWAATPQPSANHAAQGSSQGMVVGTYEPRRVFNAYHLRDAFIDKVRKLQGEMRKAQQANDRNKMLAIQKQVQDAQSRLIKQFTADLDRVMPTVAKQANVTLVAVDVAYKAPNIRTKDVTGLVIQQVNQGATTQPSTQSRQNQKPSSANGG